MLTVFNIAKPGLVDTVEKNELLEYRTMHSSYQITARLDKEQSKGSFLVALTTHS
jgi:hypothetical protein